MSNHQPTTLSAIAKVNGIDVRSLYELLKPYTAVQAEIDCCTQFSKRKANKLLSAKVVKMIKEAIGEP